mgnify:CR=1 FL=1|tara:strand:+ start:161 stop:1633 length:1473 start_codon:yes stop_codon:yes gene_type:complete
MFQAGLCIDIMVKKTLISQKDHHAGNFGFVYRSSAIFYYTLSIKQKTTISFMNYWKPKRNLEVWIIASLRNMKGDLERREEILFADGQVINYRPEVPYLPFEGSVEIEVFSSTNMRVPYSAIMAVYESDDSVSLVHSYSRVYSPHEVEEARTITTGEESGWTLRDDSKVRGFAVFHNGNIQQDQQEITMEITNSLNETKVVHIDMPSLRAYETVKLYPSDYCPEIVEFLSGSPGNVTLSYKLANSFTRMLVGNETLDQSEMQVTHSNFNYAKHTTDFLDSEDVAFMTVPPIGSTNLGVVIYPGFQSGNYGAVYGEDEVLFSDGMRLEFPVKGGVIYFNKKDGLLPTRIVTALTGRLEASNCVLPFECSLGVFHTQSPPRGTHWAVVTADSKYRSRLIAVHYPEIYENNEDGKYDIWLYSSKNMSTLHKSVTAENLEDFRTGVYISDIFPEAESFLDGDFGYFYLKSPYVGLIIYSTIESTTGSMTLEHSF